MYPYNVFRLLCMPTGDAWLPTIGLCRLPRIPEAAVRPRRARQRAAASDASSVQEGTAQSARIIST